MMTTVYLESDFYAKIAWVEKEKAKNKNEHWIISCKT